MLTTYAGGGRGYTHSATTPEQAAPPPHKEDVMSDKLKIWQLVEQPPDWALKKITGGRLSGKTDINPQWRYLVMTEVFGPCGQGWWFTVDKQWLEPGADGVVCAFVDVTLYAEGLDKGIPGNGGALFVASEREGLHTSDEAYKMATTDALSVALKMLGVAARIYEGSPVTKYSQPEKKTGTKKQGAKETDEAGAILKAEAALNTAWDNVMEAIGEDDADNVRRLRRYFIEVTTEKSNAFLPMADSTAGMSSKEIRLLTSMLTKGHVKVEGLCLNEWRDKLGLPSLGREVCAVCGETLTEAEKASCAIAKLPGYWCTKHVSAGVKKAQSLKEEKE